MQSLDPRVIALFFIKNFLGTVYILPLWFIGVAIFEHIWTSSSPMLSEDVLILILDGAGLIFFAFLILVSYIWAYLAFKHFAYELQSDGFHLWTGSLVKKQTIIPYTDIETVELLVNPISVRILDLYSLRIKTKELEDTNGLFKKKQIYFIPGLTSDVARDLRAELLQGTHIQKVKKTYFDPMSGNYR